MCQYANVPIAMQYAAAQPIGILAYWHIGILARYSAYYSNCFSVMLKALSCNECKFVSVRR